MTKKNKMYYLSEEVILEIKAIAARDGCTEGAVIGRAVKFYNTLDDRIENASSNVIEKQNQVIETLIVEHDKKIIAEMKKLSEGVENHFKNHSY